jgi:hypothetical protein
MCAVGRINKKNHHHGQGGEGKNRIVEARSELDEWRRRRGGGWAWGYVGCRREEYGDGGKKEGSMNVWLKLPVFTAAFRPSVVVDWAEGQRRFDEKRRGGGTREESIRFGWRGTRQ